ncbi:hypothetical protein AGDE_10738 [Angomonas deanei]|nr:hypothetical protein AGDE_10738 [Angomonas deanei]|eukprot:EPY27494.1 hypothetical protein AGDE_10738 [Angomonas deanei]
MEFTFIGLYLLNSYVYHCGPPLFTIPLEEIHGALALLTERWEAHLDGEIPKDVHELWPPRKK